MTPRTISSPFFASQPRSNGSTATGGMIRNPKNSRTTTLFAIPPPEELLEWHRKNTRGSIVKYDEEEFLLYINQETESWWTKMRNRFPILRGIF